MQATQTIVYGKKDQDAFIHSVAAQSCMYFVYSI